MYYFSKQAGRFKDYCVAWFDINLLTVCVLYFMWKLHIYIRILTAPNGF